jgi:hypothetical protein
MKKGWKAKEFDLTVNDGSGSSSRRGGTVASSSSVVDGGNSQSSPSPSSLSRLSIPQEDPDGHEDDMIHHAKPASVPNSTPPTTQAHNPSKRHFPSIDDIIKRHSAALAKPQNQAKEHARQQLGLPHRPRTPTSAGVGSFEAEGSRHHRYRTSATPDSARTAPRQPARTASTPAIPKRSSSSPNASCTSSTISSAVRPPRLTNRSSSESTSLEETSPDECIRRQAFLSQVALSQLEEEQSRSATPKTP